MGWLAALGWLGLQCWFGLQGWFGSQRWFGLQSHRFGLHSWFGLQSCKAIICRITMTDASKSEFMLAGLITLLTTVT